MRCFDSPGMVAFVVVKHGSLLRALIGSVVVSQRFREVFACCLFVRFSKIVTLRSVFNLSTDVRPLGHVHS